VTVLNETSIWPFWFEVLLLETLVKKGKAQEEATANRHPGVEERLRGKSKN